MASYEESGTTSLLSEAEKEKEGAARALPSRPRRAGHHPHHVRRGSGGRY